MTQTQYAVIGVMSGTSLDGVDLVYATFSLTAHWSFKIHHATTIPYTCAWKKRLSDLPHVSLKVLNDIDTDYTSFLATSITTFIREHSIQDLDAICSHGHTAWHRPEAGITHQIGNLPQLAKLLNRVVVCDFRTQDVALGGQGAPLVPIGDRLLFSEYDFCLNLGGFANISKTTAKTTTAFDICPANIVLNHYATLLGHEFDAQGALAATGQCNQVLLTQLNRLPYYNRTHPKSLGLEWVQSVMLPIIDNLGLAPTDVLKTFCEHVAIQIDQATSGSHKGQILVTGGGAYNRYLLARIGACSMHEIIVPSDMIVKFKEALIFGLLGILRLRKEINCLKDVTGASRDHSSGLVFLP